MTITLEQSPIAVVDWESPGYPGVHTIRVYRHAPPICKARARRSRTPPRTCSDKRAPIGLRRRWLAPGKPREHPRRHKGVPRLTLGSGPNGRSSRRHTRGWVTSLLRNALHQGRAGSGEHKKVGGIMVPFASPHSGTQRRLRQNVSPMVSTLSSYESIIDIIISGSMIPPTFLCSPQNN